MNEAVSATYSCLFGISDSIPGIEKRSLHLVLNDKSSYLIGNGTNNAYWILFQRMSKTFYGANVPRLTKEDEVSLVKEHLGDYVSPAVHFSDLYKNRKKSVYTSLVEHVFKRWYFKRIITIGDACHKVRLYICIHLYKNTAHQATATPLNRPRRQYSH